jgi:hypothetical protein
LLLASLLLALTIRATLQTSGPLRLALVACLLVWAITSLIATVEENRTTWLLFGLILLAARLAAEDPRGLAACFRSAPRPSAAPAPPLAVQPGS